VEELAYNLADDLNKQDSHLILQRFIDEEIPRLRGELKNEVEIRKEMDIKIYEQFMSQIEELHESFEHDKRERENRSEEFLQLLKRVSNTVSAEIAKSRQDRENNNEMLLNLIEKMIERIKKEALEVFN